jgi:hypothetical protein
MQEAVAPFLVSEMNRRETVYRAGRYVLTIMIDGWDTFFTRVKIFLIVMRLHDDMMRVSMGPISFSSILMNSHPIKIDKARKHVSMTGKFQRVSSHCVSPARFESA